MKLAAQPTCSVVLGARAFRQVRCGSGGVKTAGGGGGGRPRWGIHLMMVPI